jgi:hypothetical protein
MNNAEFSENAEKNNNYKNSAGLSGLCDLCVNYQFHHKTNQGCYDILDYSNPGFAPGYDIIPLRGTTSIKL